MRDWNWHGNTNRPTPWKVPEPDVIEPDVVEPDVVEPDVVEPDVVEPDVVEENYFEEPEFEDYRPHWKQMILDDFTLWLDELEDMPVADDSFEDHSNGPDLETLLREFTALRQEVRLQSRSGNRISEQVERLAGELTQKLDTVSTVAASIREDIPKARKESKKRVVQEILEIVEAIKRTGSAIDSVSLPSVLLSASAKKRAKEDLLRPIRLLQSKVADLVRRIGLEESVVIGAPFDAETMRAVATTSIGAAKNTITEILRQGYRLDGEIILVAEVNVEK